MQLTYTYIHLHIPRDALQIDKTRSPSRDDATMKKIQQALSKKPGKVAAARAQQAGAVEQQPLLSPKIRPQPYQHISLGSGGVISQKPANNLSESKTFVGTTGTLDTVGVFFEISDTQSFAAHIEAYTTKRLSSSSSTEKRSYCLNFQSAFKLRSQVIARLDKIVPEPPSDRMRGTLVMTCSRLSGKEARASEVMAKAVKEWLGAGLSSGGRVAVAGMGFVVGWPAGGRVIFETAVGEEWKAVECRIGEGEWRFGVVEREVQGSEEAW